MFFSLGEAIIDIFEGDRLELLGGTSANFCAAIANLGGKATIITKLGRDSAERISSELDAINVDTSRILIDPIRPTGKVIVSSLSGSSLCAKRKFCADCYITEREIDAETFSGGDILHFCSFALTECPTKYAVQKAVNVMLERGGKIAFDINFRARQWKDNKECIVAIESVLTKTHYLKASAEELKILYDNQPLDNIVKSFFVFSPSLKAVILSKGEQGSALYTRNNGVFNAKVYDTKVIDTTGAGDCLFAAAVYLLSLQKCPNSDDFQRIIDFAAAAAALKVEKLGGTATPNMEQVKKFLTTK